MDSRADRTVALMAIQPRFAQLILCGAKRVEFRKTRFRQTVTHVLIYSSGPVSKVVGGFEVEGVDEADPDDLWNRYVAVGGVSAVDFDTYYGGRSSGVAIRIGRVFELANPLPLDAVCRGSNPPQSFRYLGNSALQTLGVVLPAGLMMPGGKPPIGGDVGGRRR